MENECLIQGIEILYLMVGGYFDVKEKLLPTKLFVIFGSFFFVSNFFRNNQNLKEMMLGSLVGMVLLMIGWFTREAIGYGDGFGVVVLGMVEGFSMTIQIVWLAFVLSGIYGLWQLIILRKGKTDSIPFFPFLFLAKLGALIL